MNKRHTHRKPRTDEEMRILEIGLEQKRLRARYMSIREAAFADIDAQGQIIKNCIFSAPLLCAGIALTVILKSESVFFEIVLFATGYMFGFVVDQCLSYRKIEKARREYEKELDEICARLKAIALELRSA